MLITYERRIFTWRISVVKNQEGIYFVYRSTRQVYKVRITDIMYFARSGRRVTMYSRELGAIELYCSLSEIYELLFSDGFYYINKSVIVNLFHITNIKNNFARIAEMVIVLRLARQEEPL